MDVTVIIAVLALVTFGAVLVFALRSKKVVEDRREADTAKSTLAKDGPNQR